jgi:hypothetical protein
MKYRQQVRVAYVMMVHSMHHAVAWRRVPCAAQFCAATDTIDYFPSILIPGRNYCIT